MPRKDREWKDNGYYEYSDKFLPRTDSEWKEKEAGLIQTVF